jgi:hypothetical protein
MPTSRKPFIACKLAVVAASLHILAGTGLSQVIRKAPSNFKLDGAIGEWSGNGTGGPFWIAQNGDGLVLAGSSKFLSLGPANDASELLTKGRLELWLSEVDSVEMPPITWLSAYPLTEEICGQFSGGAAGKLSCLEWLADQPAYRDKVRGLFTRMWRLAPGVVEEDHATKIFDSLSDAQRNAVKLLKPSSGLPVAKFTFDAFRQAFTFEILVPWDAFPPASRLHLEKIRLALNIVEENDIRASTQPRLEATIEKPRLRSYTLSPVPVAHYTPCDYPLATENGWADPVYYFMDRSLMVRQALSLQNEAPPHFTMAPPGPSDFSPSAIAVQHFVQTLAPGEFLCNPPLVYRKGAVLKQSPLPLDWGPALTLEVRRLPSGTRLLKDGPTWYYRQQSYTQCGGCPWGRLLIFALTPAGDVKQVLGLGERVDGPEVDGYDIEISPDWSAVKEFKSQQGKWGSKSFCLERDSYRACGEDNSSPPPKRALALPPP